MSTRFVKLTRDNISHDGRVYPANAVIEVDSRFRDHLVDAKAAEDHPGPGFDPSASRKAGGRENASA